MINQSHINFYFGEVVENANTYSKKNTDPNVLFPITVLVKQNNNTKTIENVKPASNSIKQIPVKGETVLIFQGYDHTTSAKQRYLQWYYFPTVAIQSGINNNILPINSDVFNPDPAFQRRTVAALQPYRGDTLIEGRYGNTIRLGSTISSATYDADATWSGKTVTDPIIILSTSTSNKTDYRVEDVESDASSIYLTSTQQLDKLKLSNSLKCNQNFAGSQLVGVADRIVLRAKQDIAVIDSPKSIILNTPGEVKIGTDEANISMVHGDVLLTVLQRILNQLNMPIQCGTMTGTFTSKTNLIAAQQELQNLLSSTYFIDKNTY